MTVGVHLIERFGAPLTVGVHLQPFNGSKSDSTRHPLGTNKSAAVGTVLQPPMMCSDLSLVSQIAHNMYILGPCCKVSL